MYRCSIGLFGDRINFSSDCEAAFAMINAMRDFFFNDYFCVEGYDETNQYELMYINTDSPAKLVKNGNTFIYQDDWKQIGNTKQLLAIIYQIIELQREESDRFVLHASAVSTPEGTLVLAGEAGSGKTSLMLRLCRKNGYKMVSNDKVVVGARDNELYVERGSRYLNLRKSSVDIYNPDLGTCFKTNASSTWSNKVAIYPEHVGIEFETTQTPLLAILFLNILDNWKGAPEYYILPRKNGGKSKWSDLAGIYDAFSKTIRGVDQISVTAGNRINQDFYMPLIDTPISSWHRKRFINNLIDEEKLFVLRGNILDAENVIKGIMNSQKHI